MANEHVTVLLYILMTEYMKRGSTLFCLKRSRKFRLRDCLTVSEQRFFSNGLVFTKTYRSDPLLWNTGKIFEILGTTVCLTEAIRRCCGRSSNW